MKFRSRTSGPVKMTTETGSKFAPVYEMELDKDNHKTLKQTGETNAYAKIQEYLEETKIENILTRVALGDAEALNKVQGNYLDTTDMPKNLAEAQNAIIRLTEQFNQLPIDVRREFDMSPEKYIAEYGGDRWMSAMGLDQKAVAEEVSHETLEKEEAANE